MTDTPGSAPPADPSSAPAAPPANNDPGGPSGGPISVPIAPLPPGPAAPAAPAAPGAAPPPGEIYKPDGIAPELLGKNNNETIDNLMKINKGFLTAQSKRGSVPDKADAYTIGEIPPALAKKIGADLSKDPAVGALREVALDLGFTDKQFSGMVPKLLEKFDKLGFVPDKAAFDPETQIGELEKDHQSIADPRERRVAAARRIPEAKAKLDNLLAANVLTKDEHAEMLSLLPQAKTFRLLEKQLAAFTKGDGTVAPGAGGTPAGGVSDADILARRMDPRYDSRSPKHDPAFRAETDRIWQENASRKRAG
jgi:hypothetical protein